MTATKKKPERHSPRHARGERQVKVDASQWEALRIRSRTLDALRMGGGLPCSKCGDCLMVADRCPGCGHVHLVAE